LGVPPASPGSGCGSVSQQTTLANGVETAQTARGLAPSGSHPFYEDAAVSRAWSGANSTSGAVVRHPALLRIPGTAALRAASLQAPGGSVPAVHLLSVPARSRTPHSLFAVRRVGEARGEGPPLTFGQPNRYCRPGIAPGPRTRSCGASSPLPPVRLCPRPGYAARGCTCGHPFFRTAPAGGIPVCRYFHSSIRSFRASATIPTLRSRGLPLPYRSWYHRLSSLCGW